jgi:hypothetical protein
MRNTSGVETESYPVTGYDVNGNVMSTAVDKAAYIALWNADNDNRIIGTLYGAGGPFGFLLVVNNGQTPPAWVLGNSGGTSPNLSPTANAGADQTITLPTTTATLSGTGLDLDGTIASYLWTKVSGPTGGAITTPAAASTGLTGLTAGIYVYRLRVTDNLGATGDDTVTITVNAAAFVFTAQPTSQTVVEGATVTLNATVANGSPNYTPRWYKNGALFFTQAAQSSTTFSATFTPATGDVFALQVTDSLGNIITSNSATITVTPAAINVTFGWSASDPYVDDATAPTVSNATTQSITHNANLSKSFPSSAPDNYIIVKEPATEPVKTSFNNGTNTLVGNVIPEYEFRAPFVVGGFRYYVSRNPLGFDYTQPLNFLQ